MMHWLDRSAINLLNITRVFIHANEVCNNLYIVFDFKK